MQWLDLEYETWAQWNITNFGSHSIPNGYVDLWKKKYIEILRNFFQLFPSFIIRRWCFCNYTLSDKINSAKLNRMILWINPANIENGKIFKCRGRWSWKKSIYTDISIHFEFIVFFFLSRNIMARIMCIWNLITFD